MAQGFPQRPPLPPARGIGATGSNTFVYGKQQQHSAKSRLNRRNRTAKPSSKGKRTRRIRGRGGTGHTTSRATNRRGFTTAAVRHGQKGGANVAATHGNTKKGYFGAVAAGRPSGDFGRGGKTELYSRSAGGPFMLLARGKGMMRPRGRPRTKQGARRSGEIGMGGM